MWVLLRWYLNHSIFARIHVMAIRIIQFLFGMWQWCGKVLRQNTWPVLLLTHWFVFYYFCCRVMYLERPEITRKQEVSFAQWFCELVWWYAETWTAVLLFLGSTVLESCFLFARLQTKQKIKNQQAAPCWFLRIPYLLVRSPLSALLRQRQRNTFLHGWPSNVILSSSLCPRIVWCPQGCVKSRGLTSIGETISWCRGIWLWDLGSLL